MRLEPVTIIPPIPLLFGSLILHSPGSSAPLSEDVSLVACGNALGPWSGLINSSSPWAEGEGIARSGWLDRFLLGLHWAAGTLTSITAQLCSVKRGKSRKNPPHNEFWLCPSVKYKTFIQGSHNIWSSNLHVLYFNLGDAHFILFYIFFYFKLTVQKPRCIKGLYLASFLFRVNFIITDIIGVTLWLN